MSESESPMPSTEIPATVTAADLSFKGVEVVIRNRRAQPFFGRHPWVFVGAVEEIRGAAKDQIPPGSIVRLVSSEGRFIAWGLYNANSRIVVRLYSWQPAETLDAALWKMLVQQAVASRRSLFDLKSASVGCRLIFSESDGLSGLTVDLYGGYLLVQFTSLALYQHRDAILAALLTKSIRRAFGSAPKRGCERPKGWMLLTG